MLAALAVVLVSGVLAHGWESDVEVHDVVPTAVPNVVEVNELRGDVPGFFNQFVAHVAVATDPSQLSFLPPSPNCSSLSVASEADGAERCEVVTNAGFFIPAGNAPQSDGNRCLGTLKSDDTVVVSSDAKLATLGVCGDRIVTGYLNTSTRENMGCGNLITGQGWLVRNGESYINTALQIEDMTLQRSGSPSRFANLQAPRTAIGHDADGQILIIAVDGDEPSQAGVQLAGLAEILISVGAVNAINLDGGGSSSMFDRGVLVNVPSDECRSGAMPKYRCARPVSSVACLSVPRPRTQTPLPTIPAVPPPARPKSSHRVVLIVIAACVTEAFVLFMAMIVWRRRKHEFLVVSDEELERDPIIAREREDPDTVHHHEEEE